MDLPDCPVCGSKNRPEALRQQLLGRHEVAYYSCAGCGLLQTEPPHWLDEAYQQAIADTDTGLLQRNLENARFLNALLQIGFDASGRFVDVAGGYGVLTRLMRDRGFDTYRSDKYCANLFAHGHEPTEGMTAEALFAFEVLEHVVDPVDFIETEFKRYGCRSMVISTLTFEGMPPATDWWYYACDTGQHITFYQSRTLRTIAEKLDCNYVRFSDALHLITDKSPTQLTTFWLSRQRTRRLIEGWYWWLRHRPALTWSDHRDASQRLKNRKAMSP